MYYMPSLDLRRLQRLFHDRQRLLIYVSRWANGSAVILVCQNSNSEAEVRLFDTMHLVICINSWSITLIIMWEITRFVRFEDMDNKRFSPCSGTVSIHPDSIKKLNIRGGRVK